MEKDIELEKNIIMVILYLKENIFMEKDGMEKGKNTIIMLN